MELTQPADRHAPCPPPHQFPDWRAAVLSLFPQYFHDNFADHHAPFWEWGWNLRGGEPADPFVWLVPRGGGKSTSTEGLAALCAARGTRRYAWYVCETQDQADDHVSNIGAMLESPSIAAYNPAASQRLIGKFGNAKGWRRNRLRCASGFTVDALGLDTARRGVKLEEQRPDLIIFDDVDGKHDSPAVTRKKIEIITTSLLPAGAPALAALFVQNLIAPDSTASQLADGRADFLQGRTVIGPVPALRHFRWQREGPRAVITSGEPTWAGMDVAACQKKIDDFGIAAFLQECQHEVRGNVDGALFAEFDEAVHVITQSEFQRACGWQAMNEQGGFRIPERWNLGRGMDWGTTVAHPCALVWAARPPVDDPLSDCVFIYREIVRPDFPPQASGAPFLVSPQRIATLITEAEKPHAEGLRMQMALMSHEQTTAQNALLIDCVPPVLFDKVEPDRRGGIALVQNVLQIDGSRPHPFRRHPLTEQPLPGRPRLFFIVADDQGALGVDAEGRLTVSPPRDAQGLARLRWEFPQYRHPVSADGTEQHRTPILNNDAIDALRFLATGFFPQPGDLSEQQKRDQALPEEMRSRKLRQFLAEGGAPAVEAFRDTLARLEKQRRGETPKTRSGDAGRRTLRDLRQRKH